MKTRYLIFTLIFLLAGAAMAENLPGPKNKSVQKGNKNKKKKFQRMFGK